MRGTAAAAAHNARNRRIEPEADGNARAGRAPLAKREPWTSSRREAAAPGAEADTLYVNARQVQYELSVMAAHKGFWSYLLFFVSFIALVSHRLDIDEGRSTLSWYGDAVSSTYDMANGEAGAFCLPNLLGGAATVDCYTPFTELQSDADLSGFVQADLSRYIAGIKAFCPDCGVGVRTRPATRARASQESLSARRRWSRPTLVPTCARALRPRRPPRPHARQTADCAQLSLSQTRISSQCRPTA